MRHQPPRRLVPRKAPTVSLQKQPAPPPQQVDGFLVSFPRSGNHIARAVIEKMTHQTTLGCASNSLEVPFSQTALQSVVQVDRTKPPSFRKCHWVHEFSPQDLSRMSQKKFILLLRHPVEAILSDTRGCTAGLEDARKKIKNYTDLIHLYSRWTGPKHILFYEDLIHEEKQSRLKTLQDLALFLQVPNPETVASKCHSDWDALQEQTKQFMSAHTNSGARAPTSFASMTFYRDKYPGQVQALAGDFKAVCQFLASISAGRYTVSM